MGPDNTDSAMFRAFDVMTTFPADPYGALLLLIEQGTEMSQHMFGITIVPEPKMRG